MKKEKYVTIYNVATGEHMNVPESHVGNYVGKGYTKTKPTSKKES